MSGEDAFLRSLLATPDDPRLRHVYADWLEERGDRPRAQFLRLDPGFDRISYIDWLQRDGGLDYYLQHFEAVRSLAEERQSTEHLRRQLQALRAEIDPDWVAFMDTLGCPFRPFFFFNNHGDPQEFTADELPFSEQIGTRGAVVTFQSAFQDGESWDSCVLPDLQFLCQLRLGDCYYGAASCPLHPFICELPAGRRPLTGADVIAALKSCDFRSEHIRTLDATSIPFPGYHPDTDNDEIHTDPAHQHIFRRPRNEREEGGGEHDAGESSDAHAALKSYVDGEQIWYVLLHGTPEVIEGMQFSRYVVLFAVGRSPRGNRLMGVVTHQVCHNLCD